MLMTAEPNGSLAGRTVLIRADLENGIKPALGALVARFTQAGARVAVIAGHGDPAGDINPALSLERFAEPLARAAGCPVAFIGQSVGAGGESGLDRVGFGEAALMENLRFHPSRQRNARAFALRLSVLGDYFVDTGAPPPSGDGWQAHLRGLLPKPAFARAIPQTREEA